MESWDRTGLVFLLVISLVILGLVFSNASISGHSISDVFKNGISANDQAMSMSFFTILLLVASVITIFVIYFIHGRND